MQTSADKQKLSTESKSYTQSDWQGGNVSLKQEFDYWIDNVEGTIPTELQGTLFRNIPAMLDVNGQRLHHPFDGDGMIVRVSFSEGRAHFRNRYVRTEGYLAEQEAGKILYRGVFGTEKQGGALANAFDFRLKNVANTHVIYWGGKLLALWEASHPHSLDPNSLETLGIETLNGVLHKNQPFAAHPKIDPGSDNSESRLVTFSIKSGLISTITTYELDQTAKVIKKREESIPGFAFIHDFAITPNYCIFFQYPLILNPLPYVWGLRGPAECIKFLANKPTKIWLIPRNESKKVQVLETKAGFIFHHANAFEVGDEIIIDSVGYENFPAIDHNLSYNDVEFDKVPPGELWRFHLDLQTKTVSRRLINGRSCDFPFINPAYVGKPHRWIFLAVAHHPIGNAPKQAILKINPETGEQDFWSAATRGFVEEPIFVPRPHSTEEDDGWVLTFVYDAANNRSDVVILDGKCLSKGPIARLHLRHHIPYGLHGSFTSIV